MNFQLTDSAGTAYLFECAGDPELLGVSRDKFGSNLPAATCPQGWKLRIAFRLGVHHPVPVPVAPETDYSRHSSARFLCLAQWQCEQDNRDISMMFLA